MIHFLLMLAVFGFVVWLILQIPMPAIFRQLILGILTFVLILWILQLFGVHTGFPRIEW